MESESIAEDGLINSSLLRSGGGGGGGLDQAESGSSATVILVFSTFIAVCGSFIFGTSIGYSSPAEEGIIDDLGLSIAEYSVFGSILSFGGMLGALISGRLTDLIGRRGAMGISDIFCIMGWIAIIFSKAAWLLDIGRFFIGFGVGILSYVVPVYISEIAPKNLRGRFATAVQIMLCLGSSYTYFIGAIISWRTLAIIEIIPCLVQFLGLFIIPESPRWLARIGRDKECEAAIYRIRGERVDISQEVAEIMDCTRTHLQEGRFLDLFQRIYAVPLIIGVGLMLLQQFGGGNGIFSYASSIFKSTGFSSNVGTTVTAIIQIPLALLGLLLLDKSGRRPLLMISSAGTCLGCLIVGLSFLLKDHQLCKEVTPSLAFVGIQMYAGSFAFGLGGIPWLIMSEIFPINMKGSAGSLVSLANWLSSWMITYIINFLMEWSSAVPETKGRTLEEIQASMNPVLTSRRQTSWN